MSFFARSCKRVIGIFFHIEFSPEIYLFVKLPHNGEICLKMSLCHIVDHTFFLQLQVDQSMWLNNPGPTVCVRTASDDQCILLISGRDSLGTNGCVRCLFIKTFASDGFDADPPTVLATLVRRLTDESLRCSW